MLPQMPPSGIAEDLGQFKMVHGRARKKKPLGKFQGALGHHSAKFVGHYIKGFCNPMYGYWGWVTETHREPIES